MKSGDDWQQLDPRTAWLDIGVLVPILVGLVWFLLFGDGFKSPLVSLAFVGGGFIPFIVGDLIRCLTTRFSISDERVKLEYGLIWKVRRSIPRDRIRSVDITANPLYRIFHLAVVKLGTGQHASNVEKGELALDALSLTYATELQQRLLQRSTGNEKTATKTPEILLATFQAKGIPYAILGFSGIALLGVASGALMQVLEWINADFAALWREATRIAERYSDAAWIAGAVLVGGVIVLGSILSILLYLENWSGYRLTRVKGGTLRLVRGFLFTRSLSIEERRIRGVEYSEPLQIRWAKGALLRVIISGFGQKSGDTSQTASIIMPSAPRAVIDEVVSRLIHSSLRAAHFQLHRHPKAALLLIIIRRSLLALFIIGILGIALARLEWSLYWVWLPSAVLIGGAILTSFDAYKSLGHDIHDEYLVIRSGSLLRRTAVLQRSGIIGWNISQSPWQRMLNLVTVTATTAAGRGAYKIADAGSEQGIIAARSAVPRLLDDFVEQDANQP